MEIDDMIAETDTYNGLLEMNFRLWRCSLKLMISMANLEVLFQTSNFSLVCF